MISELEESLWSNLYRMEPMRGSRELKGAVMWIAGQDRSEENGFASS
jgi:hypothetical protein